MLLLLIHTASTLAMVGLIWFVQVVHYPLFALASERQFERFALEHQRRTSLVVVPLMLAELSTAVALVVVPPLDLGRGLSWLGLIILALAWLSTFVLQVPLHRRLSGGHEARSIRLLVASNWVRTLGWTVRGWIALAMVSNALVL